MRKQAFSLPQRLSQVLRLATLAVASSVTWLGAPDPAKAFLLVGNTRGNNVVIYNKAGQFSGTFIPTGSGGLTDPDDLVFGPDGNLYVSSGSGSTGQILRYNGQTGAFIDVFASGGGLIRPYGIAFGPDGYLYVSSFLTDQILRYNATTGAFVDVFAQGNGLAGGLNGPNDLLFTPSGQLLVTTQGSIAVPGASPGEFVASFPGLPSQILSYNITTGASTVFADQPTPVPDSFGFVSFLGLALSPQGNLVTTDFANGIRVYNLSTGALLSTTSTNYTGTNPSNNFIGNLTFVEKNLFTVGFDFTQNNNGAILQYPNFTGAPSGTPGFPGQIFVPTTSNLQRPIGITRQASVPEPGTAAGIVALGILGACSLRKRQKALASREG